MTNNQNVLTIKMRAKPGGPALSAVKFTQLGFYIRQPVSDPAITFGPVTNLISGVNIPSPQQSVLGGYRYYQFETAPMAPPQPAAPMTFPNDGTEFPVFSIPVNGLGTGTFQLVHNESFFPAYVNITDDTGTDISGGVFSAANVFYGNLSNEMPDFHLHTLSLVPLPLELLRFEVARKGETSVLLVWETNAERNVSHFDVERSLDGIKWSTLAKVPARNQSGGMSARYEWTDEQVATQFPSVDAFYYRLYATDLDGSGTYTPVRSIGFDRDKEVSIYPNPFQSKFFVTTSTAGELRLRIYDVGGRLLTEQTFESDGKGQVTSFDLAQNLPAGTVLVEISDAHGTILQKERLVHVQE